MTASGVPVGQQRPGGRAARVRTSVLEATSDLLADVGYDALSIDDVATRAGVHKTTIYRRWETKAALVTDAALDDSAEAIPLPDTGSLATDLQALLRTVVATLSSERGRRQSSALVLASSGSEELEQSMHRFWNRRIDIAAEIVERAKARGEVGADVDARLVVETLIGPIWVRVLLTGEPLTESLADDVAALVARAVDPH